MNQYHTSEQNEALSRAKSFCRWSGVCFAFALVALLLEGLDRIVVNPLTLLIHAHSDAATALGVLWLFASVYFFSRTIETLSEAGSPLLPQKPLRPARRNKESPRQAARYLNEKCTFLLAA